MEELADNGFHDGIRDDESLVDAGVLDSLAILVTLSFLEERFGIVLDEGKLKPEELETIDSICEFIETNGKPGKK
ncbi:MAG: acyl carrier protein [Deltaproteobacteria bacterium]|nr:acyl carrier protein [Deltaproteobacteria bacterium]